MSDLFSYRLRMICNKWIIITTIETYDCGDYFTATAKAKELEAIGYIDADRG